MRAAIIGLGQIAWRYDGGDPVDGSALTHLSALRQAGISVIGAYDPDAKARKSFTEETGIKIYDTINGLLAADPDVVTIASPNRFHAEHLKVCLDAGVKYVWLEKPATTDLAEIDELAALASRQGARVMVGFQRRYMPCYQALRQKDLGALIGIDVTYSRGLETNGAHMVDLVLSLLGDKMPSFIGAVSNTQSPTHTSEVSPSFLLQGANKVPVTVMGLDLDHHSIDIVVHYSGGRREVRHGGQSALTETKMPNPMFPGFYYLQSTHGPQDMRNEIGRVFPAMIQDLLHGTEPQPLSNLNSAGLGQTIVAQVLNACA